VVTTNVLGLALGPTLVAASTDYLFRDTLAVAHSLALVAAVAGPVASYLSGTKDWARQAGVFACVSRLFPEIITSATIVTR
jgi:hypothetical protein